MGERSAPATREIAVIAHNIRSAHNVGAILRTSDVFAVSAVH